MAENDIIDDGGVIKEAEEKKPLGEQLLEKGALSEDQLRIALFEQQSSARSIGAYFGALGLCYRGHYSRHVVRDGRCKGRGFA